MQQALLTKGGKLTRTMQWVIVTLVLTACTCALIAVWKDRNLFETGWLCVSLLAPAIGGQFIQNTMEIKGE